MKNKPLKLDYTCQNEDCNHEFEVTVYPLIPAKTYGPPENCHPEEGGEMEPEECPECDVLVDVDIIMKKVNDICERWDE